MTFEILAIQEGFDWDELLELSEAAGSRDLLYKGIHEFPCEMWAAFLIGLKAEKTKNEDALAWFD